MMEYLQYLLFSAMSIWIFFLVIVLFLLLGRYWAIYKYGLYSVNSGESVKVSDDIKVFEATIYTIMGLLIAFTFSGANTRVDQQRKMIIDQIDSFVAIYYLLDVLPKPAVKEVKSQFKECVKGQIKWSQLTTRSAREQQRQIYLQAQQKLWDLVVENCFNSKAITCRVLLNNLTNMIVLENKKALYKHIHPPTIIYVLLFCIVLLSSFLAGYRIRGELKEVVLYMFVFAIILSIMIFMILNLEYPNAGIFSVDIFGTFNQAYLKLEYLLK